jgi:hypothetical protein
MLESSDFRFSVTLRLRLGLMSLGPAAGIEPATLCLLGSRSSELSYAGVWYPAQESNPEPACFAGLPEIRLARQFGPGRRTCTSDQRHIRPRLCC